MPILWIAANPITWAGLVTLKINRKGDKMDNWGWTSYKHLYWNDGAGHKLYEGKFKKENDPYSWTLQTVRFWASRPIKALSAICRSGKQPLEFCNKVIN